MKDNLTIIKSCEAFLEGHFLLSSGRHSGGYCQCAKLLRFPALSEEVLSTVTEQVKNLPITKVCGPAMGGVIVSYELARQLGGVESTGSGCTTASMGSRHATSSSRSAIPLRSSGRSSSVFHTARIAPRIHTATRSV